MSPTYPPRTVAMVALASLVVGFLLVFGGGMLALRPRARDGAGPASVDTSRPIRAGAGELAHETDAGNRTAVAERPDENAAPVVMAPDSENDAGPGTAPAVAAPAPDPVQVAGITLGPASISRCFDRGPPTPIAGSQCDRLSGLDRHFVAKAAEIAACARNGAHGRLALVMEFRFSTSFMRGWGSPTSNIANPGAVSACVKTVISPLPFAQIPHEHDRYLVVVPIDW